MNEFTLAGAVLADSLGRGADKKETAGSRLTPRLKARHFQKNTIHPHNLAMDCFTLSGFAMTLQNNPGRIHYAQGTLRPCNPRAMASYCLILVAESVEVPSRGQELNSASLPPFYINPVIFGYKKRRGVECIYLLEAFDCPQRINANNSRPKWPFAYRQIYQICMYQNDAAGLRRSQT